MPTNIRWGRQRTRYTPLLFLLIAGCTSAPSIGCPVQFHHAEHDASISPGAVAAVRQAMDSAPSAAHAEFHHYAGAEHGFNCWARPAYHPASAALALGRSLAFLAKRLF